MRAWAASVEEVFREASARWTLLARRMRVGASRDTTYVEPTAAAAVAPSTPLTPQPNASEMSAATRRPAAVTESARDRRP